MGNTRSNRQPRGCDSPGRARPFGSQPDKLAECHKPSAEVVQQHLREQFIDDISALDKKALPDWLPFLKGLAIDDPELAYPEALVAEEVVHKVSCVSANCQLLFVPLLANPLFRR